jgi:hypothetical protein
MADSSTTVTDNEPANRDMRWPRLFAGFLWNVLWFGLGSFVVECISYRWKHNLTMSVLSIYLLVLWLAEALGFGLFLGLYIGFWTWLAQELSGRPKPDSSQRPGA